MLPKSSLLVLLPLLAAGIASADVIVFENDNPDLTNILTGFFYDPDIFYRPPQGLCVTLPASSQPVMDASTAGCVGFMTQEGFSSSTPNRFSVQPEGMNAVASEPGAVNHQGETYTYHMPAVAAPGDSYSAASDWATFGTNLTVGLHSFSFPATYTWSVDEVFTVGIRFELDSGTHYGFATFERRQPPTGWVPIYYPIRWGYESEPDTAVVVPAAPCPADLAEPFGTLNFLDVTAFLAAFNTQDPAADLAEPYAVFNFSDITAFLSSFNAGCP